MTSADEIDNYALGPALPNPGIRYIPSLGRIRAVFRRQVLADSRRAVLERRYPTAYYYFPRADVRMEYLSEAKALDGEGRRLYDVRVGDAVAARSAWSIPDPLHPGSTEDYFSFRWKDMDAWYEEDEELFVHPRDPYVRLEARQSSRPIKVVIADKVVAETIRPVLLFETGLRTRFYIPKADVRLEYFVPSDTHTGCPYKGIASYYSFQDGDTLIKDIVWYYPYPFPELGKIQNLLSFYDEKVEEFWVDGQLVERPNK